MLQRFDHALRQRDWPQLAQLAAQDQDLALFSRHQALLARRFVRELCRLHQAQHGAARAHREARLVSGAFQELLQQLPELLVLPEQLEETSCAAIAEIERRHRWLDLGRLHADAFVDDFNLEAERRRQFCAEFQDLLQFLPPEFSSLVVQDALPSARLAAPSFEPDLPPAGPAAADPEARRALSLSARVELLAEEAHREAQALPLQEPRVRALEAVSYTHLTLPTN